MTLQVSFEEYAATSKRLGINDVYLNPTGENLTLSGCNLETGVVLFGCCGKDRAEVCAHLQTSGLKVFPGSWVTGDKVTSDALPTFFVAAVSYKTAEATPGVWVDAYKEEPTHIHVLETLYREFIETGELSDITIEQFIRAASPNVVVSSSEQIQGYLRQKIESAEAGE